MKSLILLSTFLLLMGCKEKELEAKAVDPGGIAVGQISITVAQENFANGGESQYLINHSERWIGGRVTNHNPFAESYDRGWWFDLILPDGTYEGTAAIGWDPMTGRIKFLCRSWQNIDIQFTKPNGKVVSFEHRPESLQALSTWSNTEEN